MNFKLALEHLTRSPNPILILKSFLGGYDFVSSSEEGKEYVAFKFKERAKSGANYCRLSLVSDLYVLELGVVDMFDYDVISRTEGLFWENLKPAFEDETGLYLSIA